MKKFDRYLDDYTESFLGELINSKIIKQVKNPLDPEKKAYQLVNHEDGDTKENPIITPSVISPTSKDINIIQSFYDFRNILSIVHQNLFKESSQLKVSEVMDKCVELGVLDIPWKNISLLRDFFDKADDLLSDDEIKTNVARLLEENKVNFNKLILEILKFHSKESIKAYDKELLFEKNPTNEGRSLFDYSVLKNTSNRVLRVEIKFRKKNYSLKELIQQCIEILNKNLSLPEGSVHILLIVYSYGNLSELERNRFRFKQNMEENFRKYLENIHFLPIGLNHFDKISSQIADILISVWDKKIKFFKFFSQEVKSDSPGVDDHYYDKILELKKFNYEISFKPIISMGHWRFGIKFSKDPIFPYDNDRHPKGYPVFHITKNIESNLLSYTFYNSENVNVEKNTSVQNFADDRLVLKLNTFNSDTIIDVLDMHAKSILESPLVVSGYSYCKIFVWADSNNKFEFESEIAEIKIK